MFRGLPDIMLRTSKVVGLMQNMELWQSIRLPVGLVNILLPWWGLKPEHECIHFRVERNSTRIEDN
jgi:hypothetical protein